MAGKALSYQGRRILAPNELLKMHKTSPARKAVRTALHDVVHAFREENGIKAGEELTGKYLSRVGKMQKLNMESPHAHAIITLSNPETYEGIRQAGRMRASMPALNQEQMEFFSREIRAALNWRAEEEEER
ncbi:hypothetical protein HY993_03460 [Candidatus Micrarchaeota archaeon]|nr:hypothetical protein [Candidatus Micrarchaeota archaeon]